jgi:hypothetical protein
MLGEVLEQPVTEIPLRGPVSRRRSQISGLAWFGDYLILLPQYPDRFQNQLFYLTKLEIISSLRGEELKPLKPKPIPILVEALMSQLPGFQGFEAIAFEGGRAFLTVEAEVEEGMVGYLVTGNIAPDLSGLHLTGLLGTIEAQTGLNNVSDEAIVLANNQIVTIYEVNGPIINLSPLAHIFSADTLELLGTVSFPHIDYRITDATSLDEAGRFWAINGFTLPNIPPSLGTEALAAKYGVGQTHRTSQAVERLVQFQYSSTGITLVDTPPVQLELMADSARNWEGIVRLDHMEFTGFLLVTDRHPRTILAFVPYVFQ